MPVGDPNFGSFQPLGQTRKEPRWRGHAPARPGWSAGRLWFSGAWFTFRSSNVRRKSPLSSDEVTTHSAVISFNAAGTLTEISATVVEILNQRSNETEMNEQPNLPPHRPPQMAGITGTLPASCVWLPANAVSQMLAGNYLISPRVTSGEPITSTAILNEKEPRRQASGLWLNINTPGKEWGGAFRALISRRYRSIVRGSSAAEAPPRGGGSLITTPAAASVGELRAPTAPPVPRAVVASPAWRRGGDAGEPQGPGGGEQLQPARDCVSRDHGRSSGSPRSIASGNWPRLGTGSLRLR